ncbi:uncharacterized protein LOC110910772 [Helianthus annuus]|uniref:uncharacterized protein LOC110910772 n=1 Tax=Helianthus annuus TaxID=4232 RepID=UPI000B8FEEF5|nr:uncharacterized protein LOC110910772 [Helianthus annuus]
MRMSPVKWGGQPGCECHRRPCMQITEITFSIIQGILTIGDEEYGKFYNPYATSIVQFLKMATCATSGLDYFHNKRMEGIVVDWYHRQPQVLADVRRQYTEMDSTKIPPSFLKFIGEDIVFLTIPSDFATNLWGDKVPYGKTVQIRDGGSLSFVRIRNRNGQPIFTDGWINLVRKNALKLKDGVLITATGPYTFNVSWFKEYVCQNSYFTAQQKTVPEMSLMPHTFWKNFYGKNYKGEMARVYIGERFWNVKLEACSHCCCFKDGWRKLVEEVPLENECAFGCMFTLVFFM